MASGREWQAIEEIFRRAMKCRKCFSDGIAERAYVDVAQPRWIGPGYFDAAVRVLVVSLNPGAGNTPEKQFSHIPFRKILYEYRDGRKTLPELFEFQRQYIPQWGSPPGRFVGFYMDGMGLDLDKVALTNVAWCADAKNKWPAKMLRQCFQLQTGSLIAALDPDITILSGSGTHRFRPELERLVPACKIITTLHYAHRKGRDLEDKELRRVRKEIKSARKK
ncbi:MAG: hypothetical protein K9J85_11060 [Desulfobacteraceae bacterium]|nr:hypothetical protein [Desulfobacteraceae bacterium]